MNCRQFRPRVEALEDRVVPTPLVAAANSNNLAYLRFDSSSPTVTTTAGKPPNNIFGAFVFDDIATRPATGALYQTGYSLPTHGGPGQGDPELDTVDLTTGFRFGLLDISPSYLIGSKAPQGNPQQINSFPTKLAFDSNTDRLRITFSMDLSLLTASGISDFQASGSDLVDPRTLSVIEQDPAPAYASTDPNFQKTPTLALNSAYAVRPGGPSTLYAIDAAQGDLVTWDATAGVLHTVGSLGFPVGATLKVGGFTIFQNKGLNQAFAILDATGGPLLYQIDLATGAAIPVGPIPGGSSFAGLAVTPPPATVGTFDPTTATWYLRNSNSAGSPDAGSFAYGLANWVPMVGDWNGDGVASIGVFDPTSATWYLRNENSAGAPDYTPFAYGLPGWIPVVSDWTGTGHTGIGVVDPSTMTWYLRNETSAGPADGGVLSYGLVGWTPITGDWDGDGKTRIGVFDPSTATFFLAASNVQGTSISAQFAYGLAGWKPVVGNWSGTATTTIGVVDPNATWYLRNSNSAGAPDIAPFAYGLGAWTPVAGVWSVPPGGLLRPPSVARFADGTDPLRDIVPLLLGNGVGSPDAKKQSGFDVLDHSGAAAS
jgi:hypothetical protein